MLPFKSKSVDDYHGTLVGDPFRYMENPSDARTVNWAQTQTKITRKYLDSIPARGNLRSRLLKLWNYPKIYVPKQTAGKYFFQRNLGLENQAAVYVQDTLDSSPVKILDPNAFSEDGTTALTNLSISPDGKYLAYTRSDSGSDWQEIRVLDIAAGQELGDVIQWCKFTSLPWAPDNSGFFYTRFPKPGTVAPEDASNYSKVYFHRLGTKQSEDQLIYERPDYKEMGFSTKVTHDGVYLVLEIWIGTEPKNRVYYRKLSDGGSFASLLDEHDALYSLIDCTNGLFYFHTTKDAPKGRVIAIDPENPATEMWQEVVMEDEAVLEQVIMVNRKLVAVYLKDGSSVIKLFELDGTFLDTVSLPGPGTVAEVSGKPDDKEFFFSFTSYLHPTCVYRYEFSTGRTTVFFEPKLDFETDQYKTKQVFYPSKDGTKIPLFITFKKGIELNGENPTVLYGYGGFNISITPSFNPANLAWLEAGGIYAVACLRGGNEYGEEWHQAGMGPRKQNVFDDFIGAAEWLIDKKYTKPSKLAIMGRSNGGLLTAACMIQQPELFGAVISWVPVTDMLRYHLFTAGRYWIGEYGNAEASLEEFQTLYKYSPVHNIKFGTVYPPVLILTAESDDRVVPMHSLKFAAALKTASGGDNPVHLYVESKAGHGAGKPTNKLIDEAADIYAFLWDRLEV